MALIHEQLIKIMKSVTGLAKKERNQQQGFSFRGIDSTLNAVAPFLREHEVIVIPQVENITHEMVEVGRNRTSMGHVIVTVTYRFIASDQTFIDVRVYGEAMDSGDKAVAKAMSVAFRIAMLQALALPTDEKDPDHDVYERSVPQKELTAAVPSEPTPSADTLRVEILNWGHANGVAPPQIAQRFADRLGTDIRTATREQLQEFYAELSLGAKTVEVANDVPAE